MTGNDRMRDVWDGRVGEFWVAEQDRLERMDAAYGPHIISAVEPRPGQRLLDIGCGHGARTLEAAELVGPAGHVAGIDISGPMLDVARRRAADAGYDQVSFRHADAQIDDLGEAGWDAAFSQFGVMFFADVIAAFANIRRALRPGGRFVFTCWQDLGAQARWMVPVVAALQHVPVPDFDEQSWSQAAFSLADADTTRHILETAGFIRVNIESVIEPEYLGSDPADAVDFMRRDEFGDILFSAAGPEASVRGWAAVASALEEAATPAGVYLDGRAWLVTATAP